MPSTGSHDHKCSISSPQARENSTNWRTQSVREVVPIKHKTNTCFAEVLGPQTLFHSWPRRQWGRLGRLTSHLTREKITIDSQTEEKLRRDHRNGASSSNGVVRAAWHYSLCRCLAHIARTWGCCSGYSYPAFTPQLH